MIKIMHILLNELLFKFIMYVCDCVYVCVMMCVCICVSIYTCILTYESLWAESRVSALLKLQGARIFNHQKWKNMTEIFIIFNSKDTYF